MAPTASDVVWAEGDVHVRRYRREGPARLDPPVLVFLGLVGRSYVFDLWQGNSIVQLLIEAGFDTYVLDWGVPDEQDSENTLETYLLGYLPRAIRAVLAESGSEQVNLMTYCMGGTMALHALAAQPELPVRALVTMASPIDFSQLGELIGALCEDRIPPDSLLDETGNVPGSVVRESFKSRKPTGDLVNYANLWQNLWNDDYMEGYQAIGRWLQPGLAGSARDHSVGDEWLAAPARARRRAVPGPAGGRHRPPGRGRRGGRRTGAERPGAVAAGRRGAPALGAGAAPGRLVGRQAVAGIRAQRRPGARGAAGGGGRAAAGGVARVRPGRVLQLRGQPAPHLAPAVLRGPARRVLDDQGRAKASL